MSFGVPATHLWPSGRGWLPFLGLPSDLVARYLWDAIITHVTEQSLLRGAVYALEQCGLLLHDANTLYRSGSHATAVAVAAFAREELGRWKLLLGLRREVLGGKQFTVDDVIKKCGNHVAKQKAGMLSTVMVAARLSLRVSSARHRSYIDCTTLCNSRSPFRNTCRIVGKGCLCV